MRKYDEEDLRALLRRMYQMVWNACAFMATILCVEALVDRWRDHGSLLSIMCWSGLAGFCGLYCNIQTRGTWRSGEPVHGRIQALLLASWLFGLTTTAVHAGLVVRDGCALSLFGALAFFMAFWTAVVVVSVWRGLDEP